MDAQGTDEKIERLVRSVLEAVDARLEAVRQEIHDLAADVSSRHTLVTNAIADLERRLARQPAAAEATNHTDQHRMEQATQMLLERIEAMHQRTTMATNERFAQLRHEIDLLRGTPPASSSPITTDAAPHAEPTASLGSLSAPLRPHAPAPLNAPLLPEVPRITSQVPVIEKPAVVAAPAPQAAAESPIDLDRLTSLLSERLGNLHLDPLPGFDPNRPA